MKLHHNFKKLRIHVCMYVYHIVHTIGLYMLDTRGYT